jgi:hypothetical protein
MSKTDSDLKMAGAQSLRRSPRVKRDRKNPVPDVPDFLVRLVGWRRLKSAQMETRPRYRHD